MRGNCIIVTADPKGQFEEGYVAASQTFYPGTCVQQDPTIALQGGRHTYKIYDRDADGDHPAGAFWIVTEHLNALIGLDATASYAAGARCSLYSPRAGEELNLLIKNLAGTGDTHTAGDILMVDDGTGLFITTTGSPETEVALLLESMSALTADTLAWCRWAY